MEGFKGKDPHVNKSVFPLFEVQPRHKEVKYVWLASEHAVFLIVGEPRESKYSYTVQIIPLYGEFWSSKDKKVYEAEELKGYDVFLNLPKDANVDKLRGKRIVILGYDKDSVFIEENDEEKETKRFKYLFG